MREREREMGGGGSVFVTVCAHAHTHVVTHPHQGVRGQASCAVDDELLTHVDTCRCASLCAGVCVRVHVCVRAHRRSWLVPHPPCPVPAPLSQDMNENIEERINLQKALFEIEDANLFNRYELKQLDEFLEAGEWQLVVS